MHNLELPNFMIENLTVPMTSFILENLFWLLEKCVAASSSLKKIYSVVEHHKVTCEALNAFSL